jgi:[protein-PII] uridylyltransferase
VVEVHVDDDVGLLFRLASVFADLGLDVRVAKAATLGERVVDVFYVRDAEGRKLEDVTAVNLVRSAIFTCVTQS